MRAYKIWPFLSLAFIAALGLGFYYMSGFIIYGGRLPWKYNRPMEPICNSWYKSEVFKDISSTQAPTGASIKIPNCLEALEFPKQTILLETEEKLLVRLITPDLPDAPKLWLHIHGITDSYLNGMRFIDLARREGFKLLLLELQNHGGSSRHNEGSSWGCREKYDLFAALDYIHKMYPNYPMLLTGTSMGTMTITEAVLTRPHAFTQALGIIYESPVNSLASLADRLCGIAGFFCPIVYNLVLSGLTPLKSKQNFESCFMPTQPGTHIPTELWLSREEYINNEQLANASILPAHQNLSTHIFQKGTHSAYYAYNPIEFEAVFRQFWSRVNQNYKN